MAEVGSAYVSLLPSAKGFGSKMESEIGPEVNGAGKGIGSKFGTAFKVGALAVVGAGLLAGKFLKGAIDEAREAQVVTARTENVIKRMGNVAGISAKQVADLAGSISLKSGVDDEAIQSGANLLLTFGNIRNEAGKGNDIFNRTTQLMTDMSAAMGTDAKGSAIQLGKALNDPVKGVSALSRVGVSFTQAQKDQIAKMVEANDTLGAQKLILGEVEKQFGGAAAAMATPADKVAVAWGNVKEQIGTALLPVIDNVLNKVLSWMPAITSGIDTAIGRVRGFVADFKGLFSGGDGVTSGAASVVTVFQTQVLPALQSAGAYLSQQLLPAVMGVVNAFKHEFVTIAPIIQAAIAGLVARIAPHWEEIKAALIQVVQTFKSSLELIATIIRVGTDLFQSLWQRFGQRFLDYLAATFLNVVTVVRGALNIVQGLIRLVTAVIKGDWGKAWDAVKQILKGAWQIIEGTVKQGINTLKFMLSNLGSVLKPAVSKAWDLIKDAFVEGVKLSVKVVAKMPELMAAAIRGGVVILYNVGKDLIRGFINGIKSMATSILSAVGDVIQGGINKAKGMLHIGSPSKLFHQIGEWTIEGFANGIDAAGPKLLKSMQSALEKTLDQVDAFRDRVSARLDSVKSAFASLSDSVASAFSVDLFQSATAADFFHNVLGQNNTLKQMIAAFKKLKSWGLPAPFLSQLFASGNSALILELASDRTNAQIAAGAFDVGQSLSSQLGQQVGRNQYGAQIDRLDKKLERIEKHTQKLNHLAKDIGRELNNAVSHGHRKAS